jgi:ABC-type lipoprotein release transport system permease subunit
MKILLKISWRNIWRNPKRSLVMIFAIIIGLWAGIFVSSLMFGMLDQRFKTSIEQHISHLQIHNPEFLKDYDVKYGINEYEALQKQLSNDPDIKAFSGRTKVNGMLATATLTRGITINGIDPEHENLTSRLGDNIREGSYLTDAGRNAILIGKKLADKTRLQERSRLVLTFQNVEGELVSASFRVAGIYETSNSMYDERNVYLNQSDLHGYLGGEFIINEIAILGEEADFAGSLRDSYNELFPELSIRTWAEISPELGFLQEMGQTVLIFILVIILFALAFGLVNTMLMSVFERIRELGMLMAVGMNRKKIFGMIMFETAFLTFLGAAGGMVLGLLTNLIFGKTGIDLAAVGGEAMHEFGYPSLVYPILKSSFFLTLTVLVVITAFLTAIYPALKALRLKPAEAVRHE